MKSVALIIPAAGAGRRLGHDISKPYIEIAGKTILEYTLLKFSDLQELRQVVVATSAEYLNKAEQILADVFPVPVDCRCVEGGEERQHSIFNALQHIGTVDLVAVHDAVRPFIKPEVIASCIREASESGGAVVGVRVNDTIKRVDENLLVTETPDRHRLWQAQTPQIFETERLLKAHQKAMGEGFAGTDDSSLVERMGYGVRMVEGDRGNFKITHPADFKLAKLLLGE